MTQYPDNESKVKDTSSPRSKEAIAKDYQEAATAFGDLHTQMLFLKADMNIIEERLIQLTNEAAQAATGDSNA